VIRLLVLAALAIMMIAAQSAVLAEQPLSVQLPELGAVMAVAFTVPAPQTGPAYATPESCPYHFDSNMPPATFCVYRGVAFGDAGEVCATGVVVIWSSLASQARVSGGPGEEASASTREVYLGFIDDPELVVRGIVDPRQDDRAEMVEYTLGGGEAPQPLAGQMTLHAVRRGSADVLSIDWRAPRPFHPGSCAFASYSGTFLGMIRPPGETTTSSIPSSGRQCPRASGLGNLEAISTPEDPSPVGNAAEAWGRKSPRVEPRA
jgi:hypothetical protein